MIGRKEIRVGNIVQSQVSHRQKELIGESFVYMVQEIKTLKCELALLDDFSIDLYKTTHLYYQDIDGVLINHDWLNKLGLAKEKEYYVHSGCVGSSWATFRFALVHGGQLHCSLGDNEYGVVFAVLKYVHQLQNLYFSTTKKELINYA